MNGRFRRRCLVLALALAPLATPAFAQERLRDPLTAQAFEIHYQPLADAADVIDPLLSEEGAITLRPRLSVLVVEDRRSVLTRVADLLRSWDVPPRNVEVTLSLFLGIDRRD